MRILAVDDDPDMLAFYEVALPAAGYELTVASCGEEAWELLQQVQVPIALVNWCMPGFSGVDLCRRIRQRPGHSSYTYVMLVTALRDRRNCLEALGAGADDFFNKPIDLDLLLARLRVAKRILALQYRLSMLGDVTSICMCCSKLHDEQGGWEPVDRFIERRSDSAVSHGMCPDCFSERMRELHHSTNGP